MTLQLSRVDRGLGEFKCKKGYHMACVSRQRATHQGTLLALVYCVSDCFSGRVWHLFACVCVESCPSHSTTTVICVSTIVNHHHLWHSTTPHHHCAPQWWGQCGNMMSQAWYTCRFRQHMVKMTWHINGCAPLSRWWWHMLSSLSTLLKVSNLTPLPPLFIWEVGAMSPLAAWQLTMDEGWWTTVNQVSHPTTLPLTFFHMRSRCHFGQRQNNDGRWRQDIILSQLTTMMTPETVTSRLLLLCQLTCALHSWGIDVVHDPYPLWLCNLWNPMYILTHTCRLPWPVSRLRVSAGYRYRSSWSDPGVTRADHYLIVGWT